jgi:hypothetical protein
MEVTLHKHDFNETRHHLPPGFEHVTTALAICEELIAFVEERRRIYVWVFITSIQPRPLAEKDSQYQGGGRRQFGKNPRAYNTASPSLFCFEIRPDLERRT